MGQLTERINARIKKLLTTKDGKEKDKIIASLFEETGISYLPERKQKKIRNQIDQMILAESQKSTVPNLLREASYNVSTASEGGSTFIVGVFASANTVNGNKRIYRKDLLAREIAKLQEKVADRTLYGELDHPDQGETSLSNAAILVTELSWRENDVWGKAKVLDTQAGQTVKAILKDGRCGISSRSLGTVDPKTGEINSDLNMLAFDVVASPSNQTSWLDPIYESKKAQHPSNKIDKNQFRWIGGQHSDPIESGKISEGQKTEWLNVLRRTESRAESRKLNESEKEQAPEQIEIPLENENIWAVFENPDEEEMLCQWQGNYEPTIFCVFDDGDYDISKEFETMQEFLKFIKDEEFKFTKTISDEEMEG